MVREGLHRQEGAGCDALELRARYAVLADRGGGGELVIEPQAAPRPSGTAQLTKKSQGGRVGGIPDHPPPSPWGSA